MMDRQKRQRGAATDPDAHIAADPAEREISAAPSSTVRENPSDEDAAVDPLREKLLDAAARVFATKGYRGTKIMDIVKAAGLSSGAVYGRYESKDDLLMEAVLRHIDRLSVDRRAEYLPVVDFLAELSRSDSALEDTEAMQLEAYIAARQEPQIAAAITEARKRWRKTIVESVAQRAIAEGFATPGVDVDSAMYFMETLGLGLLVQRGAGQPAPDQEAWQALLQRVLAAITQGDPASAATSQAARRQEPGTV